MYKLKASEEMKCLLPVWIFMLIGLIVILSLPEKNNKQPQPAKQTQDRDTVTINELPVYKYPSGATGSLRFDWMTGEKGKLITDK